MADLTGIDSISFFLDETIFGLDIPSRFRYMQELWIQVRITARLPETGKVRLDLPIPRLWTGYYYLLSENCVFKHGTIEFQNQEIYRAVNLSWNTEVAVNENAFNLTTPEVPPDVDNVDEAAESDLWLGNEDLENIYLPIQLPIDNVQFYIPRGCELEVMICGRRFSPVSAFGGENDIDLYEDSDEDGEPDLLIPTPSNPLAFPPLDLGDMITSFDEIARQRGYILASECDVLAQPKVRYLYTDLLNAGISDYYVVNLISGSTLPIASFEIVYSNYNPSGGGSSAFGRTSTLNYIDDLGTSYSMVLQSNSTANHSISEVTFGTSF